MHQHGCQADLGFKKPHQPGSHGQRFPMGSIVVSQLLILGMLPLPDQWRGGEREAGGLPELSCISVPRDLSLGLVVVFFFPDPAASLIRYVT